VKIALIVPGGVDRSGEYRVIPALLALLERLSQRHEVHVYALRQEPQPGSWQLAGAHIHNLGGRCTRVRAVRAVCVEHRARAFALVHSIWAGTPGLIAISAARLLHIPSLVHVAGGELVALPDIGYGGRLSWRGRSLESVVLRAASLVTAASLPMIEALAQLRVPARRVPLGIDLQRWPTRSPTPRESGTRARLIHVASLNRVKDQPLLLHALARLAAAGVDFDMDIVGEDTLRGQIQALAQHLGLAARVRFHGFLTQRELRPLIEAAHLMVVSSRHEAGPLVVLEAATAGVPTVGTAVGHIAEWAPQAAVSVPVGDCIALADAIRSVLADEDQRLRLARAAQQRSVRENADGTAEAFSNLYATLCGDAA
jgi:glycosyltransferase involved in cell wall biosynthesis